MSWLVCVAKFSDETQRVKFIEFATVIYHKYEELDFSDQLDAFPGHFDHEIEKVGGEVEAFINREWPLQSCSPYDFVGQMLIEPIAEDVVQVMFYGIEGNAKKVSYDETQVACAVSLLKKFGADTEVLDDKVVSLMEDALYEDFSLGMAGAVEGCVTAADVKQSMEDFADMMKAVR